jgi:cytochrome c oxidase subunit 2
MSFGQKKLDFLFLVMLIGVMAGIPALIGLYERKMWQDKIPQEARVFTLTGHAQKGWLRGDVKAYDVLSFRSDKESQGKKPLIEVSKGDLVVFRLKSSDVVHGFSLKDFEVFITDGIQPGKLTLVSFRADKVGRFTFSCNAICGSNHENMQGTLVVGA